MAEAGGARERPALGTCLLPDGGGQSREGTLSARQ